MSALDTVAGLCAFERRGAGSNAERRAALWLRSELDRGGREATIEPFWCRPNWALAHAWHVGLGLAGSLVSVGSHRIGGGLILVALLAVFADAFLGISPGRRLTPEHASQNVVSGRPHAGHPKRIRLIITSNYDAGRTGLAFRAQPRAATAQLRRLGQGLGPGWLGWIALGLIWLELVAIARVGGSAGTAIGLVQLIPTVMLVLALALLLDVGSADFSPAAGDNASGVAVAIALARALDAGPPRNAAVEVVLQGASDCSGTGLRAYLRGRRESINQTNAVVLGLAPCSAGQLHWWVSDGPLIPLRYFARLRHLAQETGEQDPELLSGPHHGRSSTPALPARVRRLPAITIGALDDRGIVPRSHQSGDTPDAVDGAVLDRAVQAGLMLVEAIDASLSSGATVAAGS